jgi:hypothetical protein
MPLRRGDTRDAISQSVRRQVSESGLHSTSSEGPLKVRNIRMSDADWNRLKRFFQERGISVSAGIRMVVREYLRNNE